MPLHRRTHHWVAIALLQFLAVALPQRMAAQDVAAAPSGGAAALPLQRWGAETLHQIHADLWLSERGLYAEKATVGNQEGREPAFMWGAGVQLTALTAAARAEPARYVASARGYADALQLYWVEHDGIGGFDVLPGPKPVDRYYDDNVWIVLALAEVFEVTGDSTYLQRAEETFRFVMSGEDARLGGGLYWHEQERETKNTCSNAPGIAAALRLHLLTGKEEYLETALRLYAWTNRWLQDPADGLYWDNVDLEGEVDRRKYSYNTALMIRANLLFHDVSGESRYLDEARRIARAAEVEWVNQETGGIADGGRFAHMLLESFIAVQHRSPDPRWPQLVRRALSYVHEEVRDTNGRYASRWDRPARGPLEEYTLLDQASAARAYWVAAVDLRD